MKTVAIIGGGLSGLVAGILLARKNIHCILFERHTYPFHRVCGEYISHETTPFLKREGLFPGSHRPPDIRRFQLSTVTGKQRTLPLDLGGFGISRYAFDHHLFQRAVEAGVDVRTQTEITSVEYSGDAFILYSGHQTLQADVVLCAHGKRSRLDMHLQRDFIRERSPFVGIKYHVRADHPPDLIALHNFPGGYCGISAVEDNRVNLCYLVHRDYLRKAGSVKDLEEQFLFQNPHLQRVFTSATFLFEKPETINEVSFARKTCVENHMLMLGDASGMIAPLCGNGMAMAIHGAAIASEAVLRYLQRSTPDREVLEKEYASKWRDMFANRLRAGRILQRMFERERAAAFLVNLVMASRPLAHLVMRQSHGKEF